MATYMHTWIHDHTFTYTGTRAQMQAYVHIYMHASIHAYMHSCIYAYMHTCILAWCVYMHTHTHIYIYVIFIFEYPYLCIYPCIILCIYLCIYNYMYLSMYLSIWFYLLLIYSISCGFWPFLLCSCPQLEDLLHSCHWACQRDSWRRLDGVMASLKALVEIC